MNNSSIQQIIQKLLENPKIVQVCIIGTLTEKPYASLTYVTKTNVEKFILVDIDDLPLLLDRFVLSSIGKFQYIKMTEHNRYLHQVITDPPEGCVCHHIEQFTTDNRRDHLAVMSRSAHAKHHHLRKGQHSYNECELEAV